MLVARPGRPRVDQSRLTTDNIQLYSREKEEEAQV